GGIAVARHPVALDVVTDGVLASYAAEACGASAVSLGRPWRRWLAARRPVLPAVTEAAGDVVARIESMSPTGLTAAAQLLREQRARGWSWPAAMHDACWAVCLTGRQRAA